MANMFQQFANQQTEQTAQQQQRPNMFESFAPQNIQNTQAAEQIQEEGWYEDPVMAARMVLDGMTLGWSDEAIAAIGATYTSMTDENASYSSAYDSIHNELKAEEAAYREANPYASVALNVAGGFISPVNFVAPGYAGLSAGGKAAYTVGRGVVEGAVGGAGAAGEGNRLEGAGWGAVYGGGTSAFMSTGGAIFNSVTSRKVTQELGKGDDFVPLTLAADAGNTTEAAIGSFYRDVVGSAYGGNGVIAKQEDKIINPALVRASVATEKFQKASRNADEAIKLAQSRAKEVVNDLRTDFKIRQNELGEEAVIGRQAIGDTFERTKEQATLAATREADALTKQAEEAFRVKAYMDAMPNGARAGDIDEILTSQTANEAMMKLDNLWSDVGFGMLKNRQFRVNPVEIRKQLQAKIASDPITASLGKAEVTRVLDNAVDFLAQSTKKGGWIEGEDLSAIRSRLGQIAGMKSDAGGESAVLQTVFREMQDVLNGTVKKQLSGKALKEFEQHTKAWKSQSILRDAVAKASEAGKRGAFTGKEWVSAIGKNSARDLRQGTGPLRQDADNLVSLGAKRDAQIRASAESLVAKAEKHKVRQIRKEQARINQEKRRLTKQLNEDIKKADNKLEVTRRRELHSRNIADLEKRAEDLNNVVASLKTQQTSRDPSIFKRIAATGVLSGTYAGADLVTGTIMSRLMSTQTFQRVVAGQTGIQTLGQRAVSAMQQQAPRSGGQSIGNVVQQTMARTAAQQQQTDYDIERLRRQGLLR
jgi:hypothetical protein